LLLRKKLRFSVNFQDLGFPKLKNFLTTTMPELVKIESSGSNHSFASLKDIALAKKIKQELSQKSNYPPRKFNTFAPSKPQDQSYMQQQQM